MNQPFRITYSDEYLRYSLGDMHPMNPRRIAPVMSLLDDVLRDSDEFAVIGPNYIDPSVIEVAHSADYISSLTKLSSSHYTPSVEERGNLLQKYGLGGGDCPIFENMADISELIVGSTVTAVEAAMQDRYPRSFVLLAGLHHASRERASGFCYYNDINVAIHKIKRQYPGIKILYIDTDLHAGDGVNYEFYRDPEVLTISFHESGKYLFPGTCFSEEIGNGTGEGFAVNLPLFPYTYDDLYITAFDKYLPIFVESFNPDIIIWQAGVDGHINDPLGHLLLTTKSYSHLGQKLAQVGNLMDKPRIVALGGGGYNPVSVTKSWFAEIINLAGIKSIPEPSIDWVRQCLSEFDMDFSTGLTDPIPKFEHQEHKILLQEEFDKSCQTLETNLSPFWSL